MHYGHVWMRDRFRGGAAQAAIHSTVSALLGDKVYEAEAVPAWTAALCNDVKARLVGRMVAS